MEPNQTPMVPFLGLEIPEKVLTVLPLDYAAYVYLLACVTFFVGVARSGLSSRNKKTGFWVQSAVFFSYCAFVLHTLGLAGRWYVGGLDRPPWTNLYESLVGFAWMLSLFQVIAFKKYRIPFVGAISNPLVFLLMGMSVMTPNKGLEPLIPALQSHWLKIHVVFGMISYAGFTMAACFAFLYLIRSGVSLSKLGAGLSAMIVLNLALVGGNEYFETGHFYIARTTEKQLETGETVWVKDSVREYPGGPAITKMELVPQVHYFLTFALICFVFASIALWNFRGPNGPQDLRRRAFLPYVVGIMTMMVFMASVSYQMTFNEHLRWQSNPYLLMLLLMTFFIGAMFVVICWRYEKFVSVLPTPERLDELSYKNILFGVPFQSLLLVTGAIWAYSAWGRSWGWDPKETWALITWFAYLIYLHGKLLLGWKRELLSVIALIGFVILVFSFLGVNLVLSGLHSYGAA
jgi:ABC-type transport system involved in cytochrome c biogenesis permease subunit